MSVEMRIQNSNINQESGSNPRPVETGLTPADLKSLLSYQNVESINRAEASIRSIEQDIRNATARFISLNNSLKEQIASRNAIVSEDRSEEMIVRMHKHLSGLVEAGKFVRFYVEEPYLVGETTKIKYKYRGVIYDLGTFKVKVDYKKRDDRNSSGWIVITGSIKRENCWHPHVRDDGHPCLGNVSMDAATHARNREFGVLFDMLYDFLCSYTDGPDGRPYRNVNLWPVIGGKKPVVNVVPQAVLRDEPGTIIPAGPRGRWTQLAEQESNPVASAQANALDPGLVTVLLRLRLNVSALTQYEKMRLRALRTNDEGYARRLKYYVNWVCGRHPGEHADTMDYEVRQVLSERSLR